MADMTTEDLAALLLALRTTGDASLDRLLHELLVALYPTPEAQDS